MKESVLGPLFKLFEASLELIVPLVVASIIDNGINKGDTGHAVRFALLLVLLGAVGLGFSVTAQYFAAKASVGFVTKVRGALFTKIQTLSYSDIDELGTSTMITRMTQDASKVQSGLNLALRLLLRSPFVVFGAMIMAMTIDIEASLVFLGAIILLSIVVFGIMLITMPLYKDTQKKNDTLTLRCRQNLSGMRVIRAFCREDSEINSFKKENTLLAEAQKRVGRISSLMNPLTYVIINLAILLLIEVGALKVESGVLTQGEVVALYNYMSQILVELIKLANLIVSITKALASCSRISNVLDITPTESLGTVKEGLEGGAVIELDSLEVTYKSSREPSLEKISVRIEKGETVGIIGPTGSGKTTLVNAICGFYPASHGYVRINGIDVSEYDTQYLREKIGLVPQRATLLSGSIRDNLTLGNRGAPNEDIYAAIRIAQAEDVVEGKGGLEAIIEEGGRNLSGGQRQRLTIARALAKKPKILVLDDSASALDYATDSRLTKALKEIADTTVIIVSQRASSIMHADKIIVLDDGQAVDVGTHDELIIRCELYREIYASQFGKEALK